MSQQRQSTKEDVTVDIENVGGIEHRTVGFEPGVTVLTGENATNRTSTLRAIMAACGSDRAALRAGADTGEVTLSIGEETYTRAFTRTESGVETDGSPLLTDEYRIAAADSFAFLLADNDARLAVLDPETNLRDIVMGPVDTEAIETRIEQLQKELRAIDDAIDRRDTLRTERLPALEANRDDLQADIDDLEAQIDETTAELEAADADVETSKAEQERVDALTSDLDEARNERIRLDNRIDDEEDALAEARDEYDSIREQLDMLDIPNDDKRTGIEDELDTLRATREELNAEIDTLTTVIAFNEERLRDEGTISDAVAAALDDADPAPTSSDRSTAAALTEQLTTPDTDEETIRCWTCGQEAASAQLEATIDALREEVQARRAARSDVDAEIEELETTLDTLEEKQAEYDRLRQRMASVEDTIAETEDRLASLRQQRDEAAERVATLEAELAALDTDDETYARVIELHGELAELEAEKTQKAEQLEEVTTEIERVQDEIAELDDVEEKRAEIETELERQQRRIDRLRDEIVDRFNDHMDALLEKLAYENIERVWLERRHEEIRQGRQHVEETVFDLHVVRTTDDGTVFEDTRGVAHLSESEREVVGLVFALAGYLAHDVADDVPFMLLDSLEAIDADRVATLVEHFSSHAPYLVVVLLPEVEEPVLTDVAPDTVVRVGADTD